MKHFIATFLIFLGSVLHAEENPLGITVFGSFLHTDRVPNALFFFSYIQKNDSFELRRALRTHEIDTIVLASSGGPVREGLNMAGIIFDKKMATYVPKLPNDKGCYSACAYMFFAGETRLAAGKLGVHQIGAYDARTDGQKRKVGETQQATQSTTSEVIGFLNEFGTPPWVYERMFRSREIYAFTEEEKTNLNQGAIEATAKAGIDNFLTQLLKELEESAKPDPAPPAERFDISNKEMVKALQVLLNEAKCSAGAADGVWGGQTNAAAERFAKANDHKYSGHKSIDGRFMQLLTRREHKVCPPHPKLAATTPSQKSSPSQGRPSRPKKLHLHWRFDCKGGAGAMSVPIFGRVHSYNSSTGAVVFIIKDRDGIEGTAPASITDSYITMHGKAALMEKNFTYFKIVNEKSCPSGLVGSALK